MQHLTPFVLLVALDGCTRPPVATPPRAPAADTTARLVTQVASKLGQIEVVDQHGLRLLKVGGAIQDAVRLRPLGTQQLVSPTARLLRAIRPAARRVLVIGLGTGATSTRLRATGYRVTSVAQDAALVTVAREAFGFRGRVTVIDRIGGIRAPKQGYDAVIWNTRARPEPTLVSGEAVDTVRNGLLAPGGVLLLRVRASPNAPEVKRLVGRLGQRFTQVFGSGLDDERQNLFILHSTEPINISQADVSGLWPVTLESDRTQAAADEQRTSRTGVLLVGYLGRERHSGKLCLDLPRWGKGAVRYLLTGPKSRALARRLPRRRAFPSHQELLEARRRATTAHPLLGGGGAPRSDLRLSPIVVAVRGEARVVSVVHWDAASDAPATVKRNSHADPRLPYGGALYMLQISQVVGVFGPHRWRQALTRLSATARRTVAAIDRGDLAAAATATEQGLRQLQRAFGPVISPRMQVRVELARMQTALAAEVRRQATLNTPLEPRPLPTLLGVLEHGRACDRALEAAGHAHDRASPQVTAIAMALGRCAEAAYQRLATAERTPGQRWAASRLVQLWEQRLAWLPDAKASAVTLREQIDALRRRYEGRLRDVGPPE